MESTTKNNINKEFWIEKISETISISATQIQNIYLSGSRVYGTASETSDWDWLVIIPDEIKTTNLIEKGEINVAIYGQKEFIEMLEKNSPQAVLCIYLKEEHILKQTIIFSFQVIPSKLKYSFMRKSCSCLNRAKSYFKEKDFRRMKKMIVHAMRYALFGKQILMKGKIEDFSEANSIYYQVMNENLEKYEDWKPIESVYKPMHEKLLDDAFPRSLVPDDFLDKSEDTPIAELKRIRDFRGSFDGQAKIAILDVIRKEIMLPKEFHEEFPDFCEQFDEFYQRYDELCREIQEIYDEVNSMKLESKEQAEYVKKKGKSYEGIIFFMLKEKFSKVRELFKTNAKRKFLYGTIFK